jgi:hypothetical protein
MPDDFEDVLVSDGVDVEVKWLDGNYCWDSFTENNSNIRSCDVVYWMPLPQPPEL